MKTIKNILAKCMSVVKRLHLSNYPKSKYASNGKYIENVFSTLIFSNKSTCVLDEYGDLERDWFCFLFTVNQNDL